MSDIIHFVEFGKTAFFSKMAPIWKSIAPFDEYLRGYNFVWNNFKSQ